MDATLTVTELSASLTDVLERVRGGERFVIERDGEAIAVLAPPDPKPALTWGEFIDKYFNEWPRPDDRFADDLEAIHAAQPRVRAPEWPD